MSGRRALAVVRPDHEMVTALRLGGVWLPPFGGARSESEDVRFAPHSAWMEPMSRGIPAGICSVGSNQGLVWPQGQLRIIGYMRSLYPCARGDVAMIAPPPRPQFRLGTYNNGQPYGCSQPSSKPASSGFLRKSGLLGCGQGVNLVLTSADVTM